MGTHTQTSNNVEKITITFLNTTQKFKMMAILVMRIQTNIQKPYAKTMYTAYLITGTCTTAATGYSTQATSPQD